MAAIEVLKALRHTHDYEWLEEPGHQSRHLEWGRVCKVCHFSPDRPSWRVIVTGARNHTDRYLVWDALGAEYQHAVRLGLPMVVVEGQCPYGGAGLLAEYWCETAKEAACWVYHDPFPANWEALGKRAGPYRNQAMVDSGGDVCLAFPLMESRGTWDCVRRAKEVGIPVKEF